MAEEAAIPPKRVSLVAIRIRYLIEAIVCVEIEVTCPMHSANNIAKPRDPTTFSGRKEKGVEPYMGGRRRG